MKKTKLFLPLVLLVVLIETVTNTSALDQKPFFDTTAEQNGRIHVGKNDDAIKAIPQDYHFVNQDKLTVAVAPSDPPLLFYANDAKTPIGSEADFASAIAESLGKKLELVPIPWVDWPLGLSSGKYDAVLANVGVTEARKKKFDFSTYRQGIHGFYVKSDSPIKKIEKPEDLAGYRVVVGSGTNQERIMLRWNDIVTRENLKPIALQDYDDSAARLLAIQSGRADVIVAPHAKLAYMALRDGNLRKVGTLLAGWPDRSDVSVATRKSSGLAEPVTIAINGLIKSGVYRKILEKWHQEDEALDVSETNPQGMAEE
ncbi:ABC transporter substrate-binding protein [Bartonella apihabitans]|uniref:ABC transporter substrate-binding protein n=1 Tax=Bartonella apihabitans TaxID=2750929 RepID=UPI003997B716